MPALPAEWEKVVAAAERHRLAPELWIALGDKGLRPCLAESLRNHLRAAYGANRERNSRIRHQIGELARCLNANGICPVLLNGTGVLAAGWLGDPGVGYITRIDLLVPSDALPTALACLKSTGFRSARIKPIEIRPSFRRFTNCSCIPQPCLLPTWCCVPALATDVSVRH